MCGALERLLHTASAILQVAHLVSTHPYTISELPMAALFTNLAQVGLQKKAENVARRHTHPSFCQLRMQWAAVSIHLGLISSPVQVPAFPPSLLMIRARGGMRAR